MVSKKGFRRIIEIAQIKSKREEEKEEEEAVQRIVCSQMCESFIGSVCSGYSLAVHDYETRRSLER